MPLQKWLDQGYHVVMLHLWDWLSLNMRFFSSDGGRIDQSTIHQLVNMTSYSMTVNSINVCCIVLNMLQRVFETKYCEHFQQEVQLIWRYSLLVYYLGTSVRHQWTCHMLLLLDAIYTEGSYILNVNVLFLTNILIQVGLPGLGVLKWYQCPITCLSVLSTSKLSSGDSVLSLDMVSFLQCSGSVSNDLSGTFYMYVWCQGA